MKKITPENFEAFVAYLDLIGYKTKFSYDWDGYHSAAKWYLEKYFRSENRDEKLRTLKHWNEDNLDSIDEERELAKEFIEVYYADN